MVNSSLIKIYNGFFSRLNISTTSIVCVRVLVSIPSGRTHFIPLDQCGLSGHCRRYRSENFHFHLFFFGVATDHAPENVPINGDEIRLWIHLVWPAGLSNPISQSGPVCESHRSEQTMARFISVPVLPDKNTQIPEEILAQRKLTREKG